MDTDKGHSYYYEYYLTEKWREELDGQDIRSISASLDEELMDRLGYEVL